MGVGIADDWLNCKQAHISARRCAHMPAHQLKDKASGSSKTKKNTIHSRRDIEGCYANISVLIALPECVCVCVCQWLRVGVCLSTSVCVPRHFSSSLLSKEWLFQKVTRVFSRGLSNSCG